MSNWELLGRVPNPSGDGHETTYYRLRLEGGCLIEERRVWLDRDSWGGGRKEETNRWWVDDAEPETPKKMSLLRRMLHFLPLNRCVHTAV
jgi:hypothetical protein